MLTFTLADLFSSLIKSIEVSGEARPTKRRTNENSERSYRECKGRSVAARSVCNDAATEYSPKRRIIPPAVSSTETKEEIQVTPPKRSRRATQHRTPKRHPFPILRDSSVTTPAADFAARMMACSPPAGKQVENRWVRDASGDLLYSLFNGETA